MLETINDVCFHTGINDTPVVSTIYTGISSANVSIKLPSDGLYFCRFRKIQYKFYAMETKGIVFFIIQQQKQMLFADALAC